MQYRHVGEIGAQKRFELRFGQLQHVIFIEMLAARGIDCAIWRAHNENPPGAQNAPNLRYEARMLPYMLQGLERDDCVNRGVVEREIESVALQEPQVLGAVRLWACATDPGSISTPVTLRATFARIMEP